MALPEGVRPPPAQAGAAADFSAGWLVKAAWAAGQTYIRLNFGNDRANSLSITPATTCRFLTMTSVSAFTAFGNRPGLLQRLSPSVRDWLLRGAAAGRPSCGMHGDSR